LIIEYYLTDSIDLNLMMKESQRMGLAEMGCKMLRAKGENGWLSESKTRLLAD